MKSCRRRPAGVHVQRSIIYEVCGGARSTAGAAHLPSAVTRHVLGLWIGFLPVSSAFSASPPRRYK